MFLLGRSLSPSFSVAAILSYSSILIMGEAALPLLLAHPILLQNRFCTVYSLKPELVFSLCVRFFHSKPPSVVVIMLLPDKNLHGRQKNINPFLIRGRIKS
jgi:hypothetical protein